MEFMYILAAAAAAAAALSSVIKWVRLCMHSARTKRQDVAVSCSTLYLGIREVEYREDTQSVAFSSTILLVFEVPATVHTLPFLPW